MLIVLSFLAFTPLVKVSDFVSAFFYALYLKVFLWSPFIALEYTDLLFENIYKDVQF